MTILLVSGEESLWSLYLSGLNIISNFLNQHYYFYTCITINEYNFQNLNHKPRILKDIKLILTFFVFNGCVKRIIFLFVFCAFYSRHTPHILLRYRRIQRRLCRSFKIKKLKKKKKLLYNSTAILNQLIVFLDTISIISVNYDVT